ncbi:dynein regulatory complex protein 11 [Caerostris extrusa]|uniref:Dynein regulatory complex protein 11 n=1 Tax=Caerostris extrusa TaxID=172846 RepID=A0AAV4Y890_CAEEX|nr:dynein regulatory complex protein 11 [Caerostris extrusa]
MLNIISQKEKTTRVKIARAWTFKKALPKLIKKIGIADRILVLGTSSLPFEADVKALSGCYEKIICIFKPDYNCRSWHLKKKIPLNPSDFASKLAEFVPVYEEEHEAYRLWLRKMPIGRQRVGMYETEQEEALPEEEISEEDEY